MDRGPERLQLTTIYCIQTRGQVFVWGKLSVNERTAESPWFKFPGQREREVLAYAQYAHGPNVICDVSQSINRAPKAPVVGDCIYAPTVLPGSSSVQWLNGPLGLKNLVC